MYKPFKSRIKGLKRIQIADFKPTKGASDEDD
jgi:hypothetical protein